jgi:hypothetical protein
MFLDDNKKYKLDNFCKFVVKSLGIKSPPTIAILKDKGSIRTTASYDYTKPNKIIKVWGKNRALVDIMRSIAHELVHHKQYEDNKLKIKPPDIGGEIEDGANAIAGQLIKKFALIDKTIYDE